MSSGENGKRERQEEDDKDKRKKRARDFSHLVRGNESTSSYQWGKQESQEEETALVEKEKPNFGLSGALAEDSSTGNTLNGVVLKFTEPPEARVPTKRWRLYVFKNGETLETLHIHRNSAYLIGRERKVADVLVEHLSCSKQHAVIQYRQYVKASEDQVNVAVQVRPYILDLKSTHGTSLNGEKIKHSRYIELRHKDVLKFGHSTREYVVLDTSQG